VELALSAHILRQLGSAARPGGPRADAWVHPLSVAFVSAARMP